MVSKQNARVQPAFHSNPSVVFDDHRTERLLSKAAPALLLRLTAHSRQRPALALVRRDLHPHDAAPTATVSVAAHCHGPDIGWQLRVRRRVCDGRRDRMSPEQQALAGSFETTYESKLIRLAVLAVDPCSDPCRKQNGLN